MTKQQRDWARQYTWFYCSDSRAIWTKVDNVVTKYTSFKSLKQWTQGDNK